MMSLRRLLNPLPVNPELSPDRPSQPDDSAMSASAASLVSSKRVPKACTQCRRDKSRCDRARPCEGCVRKGRVELCLDGCVACRQDRLSCDEGRPCQACIQDSRECIEDDPAAIAASRKKQASTGKSTSTTLRPIAPQPRVHIPTPETRIKLACLACRRDNKKCTGRVDCPRCVSRGEECIYVARAAKFVKQRCALCRKKNKKCEKVRPCMHCVTAGIACIDPPRKGIGRGLRVKKACAGCRADKIQCQTERPCAGCKRKKIKCVERVCNACVEKGRKCNACRRQDHFYADGSADPESSATGDSDGEDDNTPVPSVSSPLSYRCPESQFDIQRSGKPERSPRLPAPTMHKESCVPPYSSDHDSPPTAYGLRHPHTHSDLPFAPDVLPMRPIISSATFTYTCTPALPSFTVGFSTALSLSMSMSHERTQFASEESL